jgi:hypothetical protein
LICLEIDTVPSEVTECNCSICRRYGVLWAYYSPKQVSVELSHGNTDTYMWDDKSIVFHRCANCGCVSHWAAVDPSRDRMGINARLMPLDLLASVRIRHLDGANSEKYLD